MKMHQRKCRIMQGLDDELCGKFQEEIEISDTNVSGFWEDMKVTNQTTCKIYIWHSWSNGYIISHLGLVSVD